MKLHLSLGAPPLPLVPLPESGRGRGAADVVMIDNSIKGELSVTEQSNKAIKDLIIM